MKKIFSILSLWILLFWNLANSSYTNEELWNIMLDFLNAEIKNNNAITDIQESNELKTKGTNVKWEDEIELIWWNNHIVWNKTKWLITVYSLDFSYGATIQDKNIWAENIWDTWDYFMWGWYKIEDLNNINYEARKDSDWTAIDDINEQNKWYDNEKHQATQVELRKWNCWDWFHIPSKWEFENIVTLFMQTNCTYMNCSLNIKESLKFPKSGYISRIWENQWVISLNQYDIYRVSWTAFWGLWWLWIQLEWFTEEDERWVNSLWTVIRCFKDNFIPYTMKVTYNPNWWAFSWMEVNQTKEYKYTADKNWINPIYNIQIPDRISEDLSQQSWWMFAWWYTTAENQTEEFDISNPNSTVAYAKWLPFNDIDLSIIWLTGIKIMDRNMWAEEAAEGTRYSYDSNQNEDYSKLWLYYQWWNNYWFKNTGDIGNTWSELIPNISSNPWGPGNYYYNNKFIIENNSQPWIRDLDNNLNLRWWENIDSSDNDKKWPCPNWYHIPNDLERLALIKAFDSERTIEWNNICEWINDEQYGKCFTRNLKIPFAWFRKSRDASLYPAGNIVHYWTTSSLNETYAKLIQIQNNNIFISNTTHIVWNPIRCFKNIDNWELRIKWNELKEDITYPVKWRKWIEEYANILTNIWYEFIWLYNDNLYQTEVDKKFPIWKQKTIYSKWKQNPWYSYNANWWEFQDWEKIKIIKSNLKETKIEVSNNNYTDTDHVEVIKMPWVIKYYITWTWSQTCIQYFNVYDFDKTVNNWDIFKKIVPLSKYNLRNFNFEFVVNSDVISFETTKSYCPAPTYNANIIWYWPYETEYIEEYPKLTWYSFSWRYESWAVEPFNFTWTEINQDRTFYAKWNPHHYTINFENNKWTWEIEDIYATYWEQTELPSATREWYTFIWWKAENGVIYKWNIPEWTWVTTEDWTTITLTAQWEINKSNITPTSIWWGSTIKTTNSNQSIDQEHKSADINKTENNITTNENTPTNTNRQSPQSVEEKIQTISPKSLTRWELAVFSNILLDIFPKLTENKKNVNEVCTEYTDYQEFSSKEQKAVSKLCRLAIMWINEDDKTPLETFWVHNLSNNEEFIKVVNRMTDKYSEEELKDLKSALSSLEENKEENLSFWTVVNIFKKVKNLLE